MAIRFTELVSVEELQKLLDSLYRATSIATGVLAPDGSILTASGWQNACVEFHRKNPVSAARCGESDAFITEHLHEGPFVGYRCKNGLNDYACPIMIDGEHVATLFTGQFFLEPPDDAFFLAQAAECGFDPDAYLEAIHRVPVLQRERVPSILEFLTNMAQSMAATGMARLRELAATRQLIDSKEQQLLVAFEELSREKQWIEAIVNSMPGIFYTLDFTGRFVRWNANFERVTGRDGAELARISAQDLFEGEEQDRIVAAIDKVARTGESKVEAAIMSRDGKTKPYLFSGIRADLGGTPLLIGMGIDITDRKKIENDLCRTVENLNRSNDELTQFAYVASHDLQEPLRMVSSYTQLLARRYQDQLDQDAKDFIGYAVDGANRMQRLIQDLLSYSRITSRGQAPSPLDAHDALGLAITNLQSAIRETGAMVANGDLPRVLGDRSQIAQVFQNLLGNAIKFHRSDEPPRVSVSAFPTPNHPHLWTFRIEDNGIGIEPRHFHRLFVIFHRLHGKQEYPGTGIGLALCKRIVERHGGSIWLESEVGRGTTFFFTLPSAPPKHGVDNAPGIPR